MRRRCSIKHTVLGEEAKFTSLCCHRCRSASSVVMVTPIIREGLCPKAKHSSCGVRQTTLQKLKLSFPTENCLQELELCDDPELNCTFSFSPTLSFSPLKIFPLLSRFPPVFIFSCFLYHLSESLHHFPLPHL